MTEKVCPETILEVDIQPADAKHLSALRDRLKRQHSIAMHAHDTAKIRDIADQISYTKHAALVPLARRIIEHHCTRISCGQLLCLVAQHSLDLHESDLWLARLVNHLGLSERRELFRCWAQRETHISPDAFYLLTNSVCLWDRLITYIYLSKLCDQRWVNKLLSDLPKLTQPVSNARFLQLLRDLDNDEFSVREAALTYLTSYGERVESQLKAALKHPLTPEARRRVHLILERIVIGKKSPEWKPLLDHLALGDCDKDAAVTVLRALTKGNPDAALTKAAVASLHKLSTPK